MSIISPIDFGKLFGHISNVSNDMTRTIIDWYQTASFLSNMANEITPAGAKIELTRTFPFIELFTLNPAVDFVRGHVVWNHVPMENTAVDKVPAKSLPIRSIPCGGRI